MHPLDVHPIPARPPLGLGLTVRRDGNTLSVAGELDMATAPRLDRVLRGLMETGQPLCLDLRDVTFVDCSGWRVVVDAMRRQRQAGLPDIEMVDMSVQVQRFTALFQLCSAGGHLPPSRRATPST
ncbi:STAS domain-containing protein [Jatrophihabitans sp. YIM 134969]